MQAHELDTVYATLADAIHAAGAHSELFLAMLSLRLMSQSDNVTLAQENIQSVLQDLHKHEKA